MAIKVPKNHFRPDTFGEVIQIGCGGTGSLMVPYIARAMNGSEEGKAFNYTLVDGDRVAIKNIVRQNFIAADVGKLKAEVLAERYSLAFGIEIGAMPVFVTGGNSLDPLGHYGAGIVVSCVDNNKSRMLIHEWLKDKGRYIWIDAGNEVLGGQVFIQGDAADGMTTDILKVHPEIANGADKLPTELSCAERMNSGEQSFGVNLTAANAVFNVVNALLRGERVHYYEVDFTAHNSFRKKILDDYQREYGGKP